MARAEREQGWDKSKHAVLCSTPLQAAQTGRSSHQKALPDLKTAQFIPGSVQGCCYQCGFPIFPEGNVWEYVCKPVPCAEENKAATRINGVGGNKRDNKPPPVLLPHKISMSYANFNCQKAPGQRYNLDPKLCSHPHPPSVTPAPERTGFADNE